MAVSPKSRAGIWARRSLGEAAGAEFDRGLPGGNQAVQHGPAYGSEAAGGASPHDGMRHAFS